jgi:hypothetical protein
MTLTVRARKRPTKKVFRRLIPENEKGLTEWQDLLSWIAPGALVLLVLAGCVSLLLFALGGIR